MLALAALCFFVFRAGASAGDTVLVMVEDTRYAEMPLSADAELLITNSLGQTNLLVIEDGEAYVSASDCANQICVHEGKISREGEIIVCLPHKVVVSIEKGR